MSDMSNETLQQLLTRRLDELGRRHGRQEPLSLLEAYNAIPDDDRFVTYELVRRVQKEGHHKIGARAARTLATMLDVPVEDVERAAGQRPTLGPFLLPERANRLRENERRAVLGVVDAILSAAATPAREDVTASRPASVATADEPQHGRPSDEPQRGRGSGSTTRGPRVAETPLPSKKRRRGTPPRKGRPHGTTGEER